MVEMILQDTCRAGAKKEGDKAIRAVSVRYFKSETCPFLSKSLAEEYSPAGAHPSGRLGEEPRGRPGNLLPLLAQMASGREKSELKVFGNDYPTPSVRPIVL